MPLRLPPNNVPIQHISHYAIETPPKIMSESCILATMPWRLLPNKVTTYYPLCHGDSPNNVTIQHISHYAMETPPNNVTILHISYYAIGTHLNNVTIQHISNYAMETPSK